MCKVFAGETVPIPTLLLDVSTKKSPVFTFTLPENSAVVAETPALNNALPAADISSVKAVISELLSTPLNLISLSFEADLISRFVPEFVILPNSVPSSDSIISAQPASNVISPALSNSIVEPSMCSITGVVSVLLVRVTEFVRVAKSSSDNALLNSAVVPVIVLESKSIVLLVKVCESVNVATVESIATVNVFEEPEVSIPVPPAIVSVSLSKSIDNAPPLSP